jgi:hypothetical protein
MTVEAACPSPLALLHEGRVAILAQTKRLVLLPEMATKEIRGADDSNSTDLLPPTRCSDFNKKRITKFNYVKEN